MSGWTCCLVALGVVLAGTLSLTLAAELLLGSGVHAEYPGRISFTGRGTFRRMTYQSLAWLRDEKDPRPCPLVIHLSGGDVGAAELAAPDALRARGWAALTDDRQLAQGLPLILEFRQGDHAVHASYSNPETILTCVTVGRTRDAALKPHAPDLAVSVDGKRVALPMAERNLFRMIGRPTRRTRGAAF